MTPRLPNLRQAGLATWTTFPTARGRPSAVIFKRIMFQLQAHETSIAAVQRIGLELIDANIYLLTDETIDHDLATHEARKNFKRLRALLWLVRDEIGTETFRRENACFREAALRLAALRDSAVMLATLDQVKSHYAADLDEEAFAGIRARLLAWQAQVANAHLQEGNAFAVVVDTLQEARPRFVALPLTRPDFAAFAGGLRRIYRQARQLMKAAYATRQTELFHDWRRRVKYLWHQVELLELLWPPVMAEMARELHHLATLLGDAHDLVVLRELLVAQADYFGAEADLPLLLELLGQRQAELETAALPVGRRLFAERPANFVARLGVYWQVWQQYAYNGLPPEAPPVEWVGTQAAAALLNLSVTAVRQRIANGDLPAVKVSGVWAIPRSALPV